MGGLTLRVEIRNSLFLLSRVGPISGLPTSVHSMMMVMVISIIMVPNLVQPVVVHNSPVGRGVVDALARGAFAISLQRWGAGPSRVALVD